MPAPKTSDVGARCRCRRNDTPDPAAADALLILEPDTPVAHHPLANASDNRCAAPHSLSRCASFLRAPPIVAGFIVDFPNRWRRWTQGIAFVYAISEDVDSASAEKLEREESVLGQVSRAIGCRSRSSLDAD